jgi:tRNA-specific 2-thiouridylase
MKVVLGYSGGVDSALSAELLKNMGFNVHCHYLVTNKDGDVKKIEKEAFSRGFSFSFDEKPEEFCEKVKKPFLQAYLKGMTPNPCIICNREFKFKNLIEKANSIGADFIATGHYAKARDGRIFCGEAPNDQSYMLARLSKEQSSRLVLPLGDFAKGETRAMAKELGLKSAEKPDSMEVCFVPDGDYAKWIEKRIPQKTSGDMIYMGKIVGKHEGAYHFTRGQRRGINVAVGKRVFVSDIDPETNTVYLADPEELMTREIEIGDISWINEGIYEPKKVKVRVRHSVGFLNAEFTPLKEAGGRLIFEKELRTPAKMQTAAIYVDKELFGGGFIL